MVHGLSNHLEDVGLRPQNRTNRRSAGPDRGVGAVLLRCGFGLLFVLVLVLVHVVGCGSTAPGTIGAGLGQRTDRRLFVRSLPPGEGADRAGLSVDDEIVAIEGKDVRTLMPEDVRKAVRGDVGTTLTVTVLRGGDRHDVKIVRTPLLAEKRKP